MTSDVLECCDNCDARFNPEHPQHEEAQIGGDRDLGKGYLEAVPTVCGDCVRKQTPKQHWTWEPYDLSTGRVEQQLDGALGILGDGYDQADFLRKSGWVPISSWGCDGWDLGEWPYQMVYARTGRVELPQTRLERLTRRTPMTRRTFEVKVVTEGDTDTHVFNSAEARVQWIDAWAYWFWSFHSGRFLSALERPIEDLEGPYSVDRAHSTIAPAEQGAPDA